MGTTLTSPASQLNAAPAVGLRIAPEARTVDVGGLRFGYRDYGGQGHPVVLLHGLASSSHIWDAVGSILAQTHRVVALDQRGHGTSDKPDWGYEFETVADDLAGFIDALGFDRPVVAGHSWGAHVALEFAAQRPGETAAIVLVDGGYEGLDDKSWEDVEREMSPPDLTQLTPMELLDQVKAWEWGEFWSEYVEAEVLSLFDVAEGGKVRPKLSKANHFHILRAVWEQRLDDVYQNVRVPAQLVPALAPGLSAAEARAKRERIESAARALDADVRWFEDTYHDIPLQRPQELASTIRTFIRERS